MIARNDDELQYFDKMDKERYEQERRVYKHFQQPSVGDYKFHNYRLLAEEEVPEWVRNPTREVDDTREYGKGNRIRKQVNYQDEYENSEILEMIEEYVYSLMQGSRSEEKEEKERKNCE